MTAAPRVSFAVRYPAGDGEWRYQRVMLASYGGTVHVAMEYPPAAGDLVALWDPDLHRRGLPPLPDGPTFRVVDRQWTFSSFGSMAWPYGDREPREGPLLDIIVEPAAQGAYRDETPICDESACEAVWVNGAWWMPPGADTPDPHEHEPYVPEARTPPG